MLTPEQESKILRVTKLVITAGTNTLVKYFIIGLVIVQIATLALNQLRIGFDSTDGEQRSGMALRIDYGTGCHYLESSRGNLIQRFNPDGTQYCEK